MKASAKFFTTRLQFTPYTSHDTPGIPGESNMIRGTMPIVLGIAWAGIVRADPPDLVARHLMCLRQHAPSSRWVGLTFGSWSETRGPGRSPWPEWSSSRAHRSGSRRTSSVGTHCSKRTSSRPPGRSASQPSSAMSRSTGARERSRSARRLRRRRCAPRLEKVGERYRSP